MHTIEETKERDHGPLKSSKTRKNKTGRKILTKLNKERNKTRARGEIGGENSDEILKERIYG